MTRIRMSDYHSGLIARHHVFENYPQATTQHTTASLDYLIVALSIFLQPFTVGEKRVILENHGVACALAYDSEWMAQNFSAILGLAVPRHALCSILDRTSAQVPRFLILASKPCGQTRSVWQISLSKKVNAACENALTSH